MKKGSVLQVLVLAALMAMTSLAGAAQTGLWNFDGDLTADAGGDASFVGTAASKCTFTTATIGGAQADVMRFTETDANAGIAIPSDIAANGGGAKVNQYTVVMDFMQTAYNSGWSTLFNVDGTEASTMYVDGADGSVGGWTVLGHWYTPAGLDLNNWHRIAMVVDVAGNNFWIYVDGVLKGYHSGYVASGADPSLKTLDGPLSPDPATSSTLNLFANAWAGYAGEGYVNSVATYDSLLNAGQVAELGAAAAAGIPAGVPAGNGVILESDFEETAFADGGTAYAKPVKVGDVTGIWAISKGAESTYSFYRYTTGTLELGHVAGNWDNPWFEIDTAALMAADSDMEVTFDVDPDFATTCDRADLFFMISEPGLGNGRTANVTSSDAWFILRAKPNFVYSENFNQAGGSFDANWTQINSAYGAGADIDSLKVILTYDSANTQFHAYYNINGTYTIESAHSPITVTRADTCIKVMAGYEWSTGMTAYRERISNITISDTITTTEGDTVPALVRESNFDSASGVYPITAGDLDQVWADNCTTYDYNGTGQFVAVHPAVNSGWPNAAVNTVTGTGDDCEIVIDVTPQFTADGVAQMFNIKFGASDTSVYVANLSGIGEGWGIFFGVPSAEIYDFNEAYAVRPSVAAADVDTLRLILTYEAATQEHRLFWSVNGSELLQHRAGPVTMARTGVKTEFQWQVWNAANPSAFGVGLDNWAEYNYILTDKNTEVPVTLSGFELE